MTVADDCDQEAVDRDETNDMVVAECLRVRSLQHEALAKAVALRITLNLDGSPIISKSHTHPSHSQTSRLLTSSLSLGIPVPQPTQCMRGV